MNFLQKSCERLSLPTTYAFLVESTILFDLLDAVHCTPLRLVALHCKIGEMFLTKNGFKKILDIGRRMVRSHNHQRPRKMAVWSICEYKQKISESRDSTSEIFRLFCKIFSQCFFFFGKLYKYDCHKH